MSAICGACDSGVDTAIQAEKATVKADTENQEAVAQAQVEETPSPVADMGMGQIVNVQA